MGSVGPGLPAPRRVAHLSAVALPQETGTTEHTEPCKIREGKERVATLSPEQKTVSMTALMAATFVCFLIFVGMMYALKCGHDGIMVAAVTTIMGGIIAGASGFTIGRILK